MTVCGRWHHRRSDSEGVEWRRFGQRRLGEARRYVCIVNRDKLDHLFQHCADLGIEVEWEDLGDTRHGEYRLRDDTIVLNHRLTRRQTISCLAHELGHRQFGDACSTPAKERRAWEYAAAFLVTPAAYRDAESLVGHTVGALAMELEVTPHVVEAWRRWWRKRGRALSEG